MRTKALEDFQDEVVALALKGIDKKKLAEKLSRSVENTIITGFDEAMVHLDLSDWLASELTDINTPAGKHFSKGISSITKKMALSISC